MKKVVQILSLLLVPLMFILLSTFVKAEESKPLNERNIEIFSSDECEFCVELENEMKEKYPGLNYTFKNIDSSEANMQSFQIAVFSCGLDQGSVPMYINDGVCTIGKEQILSVFVAIDDAAKIKEAVESHQGISEKIQAGLTDISNLKVTDTIIWYDYVISGVLLALLITGIYLTIKFSKSQKKKARLLAIAFVVVAIAGFLGLLYNKVNSLENLSSKGADAANCAKTDSCKDWNSLQKALAEIEKEKGNHGKAKEYEAKIISEKEQAALTAATNKAIIEGAELSHGSYAAMLNAATEKANSTFPVSAICKTDINSQECKDSKKKNAEAYMTALYTNANITSSSELTGKTNDPISGIVGQAITAYNHNQLKLAAEGFAKQVTDLGADVNEKCANNTFTKEECTRLTGHLKDLCSAINVAQANCNFTSVSNRLIALSNNLDNTTDLALIQNVFKLVPVDGGYSGITTVELNEDVFKDLRKISDACLVPTSGGACPIGTATCECQTTPVARYTCAAVGQSCHNTCIATHNVCKDCSKEPITEDDIPEPPPPGQAICRQQCSATVSCSDGSTCLNGLCVNASCPDDLDCMCNTNTPICGDGIINNSPQAPEQCELGNPPGTLCDWNSCNQNTCQCPDGEVPTDTNPHWDIEKTSSVLCVNTDPNNIYARVDYAISVTYINEDDPTEDGTLERVVDRPQNYLAQWLDTASISNEGTHTTSGGMVDEIRWDLTPPLSLFEIPSGQTEITKTDFLTYTFNVPKSYFGGYINIVSGYPNQDSDDDSFSTSHSVYIGCDIPKTALPIDAIAKIVVGMFLISIGLVFAMSRDNALAIKWLGKSASDRLSMIFAKKEEKTEISKIQFEEKVLEKKEKV